MSSFYIKLIGGVLVFALLGSGVASWLSRGARIENLESWQSTVVAATGTASSNPKLTAEQVPAAIAALRSSKDNAENALAKIDMAAQRDRTLQARLDSQLSAILDGQDANASGTRARLHDLLTRQATGDREKDCAVMEADSNAAWDGWRK